MQRRRPRNRGAYYHVVVCVFFLALWGGGAPAAWAKEYLLAVMPQQPPSVMFSTWSPLVARLAQAIAAPIRLKVYEETLEFEGDVRKGVPDFVFVSPTQAVLARRAQGYIPLVRGGKTIRGEMFVRRDSPVKRLQDLRGKTVAFVGPGNFCSARLRQALTTGPGEPLQFISKYVGSSSNVFKHILLGKTDAGAVLDVAFQREAPAVQAQLRSIYLTDELAPHPLAAHPRVPTALQQAMREAILRLAADEAGRALLQAGGLADPVAADYARDYRRLETIEMNHQSTGR